MLRQWKKTEDLAFFSEVSSVPPQHLQSAFSHFSAQGRHPRFNVSGMLRGRQARAVSDAPWSQLRSRLEYKAAWYGREVIAIDRWFPPSKACSACKTLTGSMPVGVRTRACRCGVIHDRDVNAAAETGWDRPGTNR